MHASIKLARFSQLYVKEIYDFSVVVPSENRIKNDKHSDIKRYY